jgi:hypothetical protein
LSESMSEADMRRFRQDAGVCGGASGPVGV